MYHIIDYIPLGSSFLLNGYFHHSPNTFRATLGKNQSLDRLLHLVKVQTSVKQPNTISAFCWRPAYFSSLASSSSGSAQSCRISTTVPMRMK